jgi:invasion protein IalB
MKSEQTQNKEICLTNHEGLEPNTGMVLIAAAVRKVEGEEKQQLLVRVPTAYALVIPAGVQIKIDDGQPIQLQYTICFPTSCQVQLELTKEMFDSMRKGKQMVVAAMNIQQKTMGFPVPLTGFAKAYDGAPVDSAKYEESRRQLMEMFRKRQAELAAKAQEAQQKKEAQQTAPAAGAPAGNAPGTAPPEGLDLQAQVAAAATPGAPVTRTPNWALLSAGSALVAAAAGFVLLGARRGRRSQPPPGG